MSTYRDVLVGLITDVEGIYRRQSEVLGRFEAVEDRFHAAKRELEVLDATGAKTPAAVEILDRLLEELLDAEEQEDLDDAYDAMVQARTDAEMARDRARLLFQEAA